MVRRDSCEVEVGILTCVSRSPVVGNEFRELACQVALVRVKWSVRWLELSSSQGKGQWEERYGDTG